MKSLLSAISTTAAALLGEQQVFAVGYAWHDVTLDELQGRTVVFAIDGAAAVQHLRSTHRNLTRVWLIGDTSPRPSPHCSADSATRRGRSA